MKDIINNLKISYICKNLINSSNYFFFLLETLHNDCECSLKYTNIKDDLIENKCLYCNKNYPAYFLSTPGLAWQAALKKFKVKLDLLTAMLKKHLNSIKVL